MGWAMPWQKSEAHRGRLEWRGNPRPGMWCQNYLPARWKIASRIRVMGVYWMEGVERDCRLVARSFSRTWYEYHFLLSSIISMQISSGHSSVCLPITLTLHTGIVVGQLLQKENETTNILHCNFTALLSWQEEEETLTLHTEILQQYFLASGRRDSNIGHCNITAALHGERKRRLLTLHTALLHNKRKRDSNIGHSYITALLHGKRKKRLLTLHTAILHSTSRQVEEGALTLHTAIQQYFMARGRRNSNIGHCNITAALHGKREEKS